MKLETIITAVTAFALGWVVCSIVHEAARVRLAEASSMQAEEKHRLDALAQWHREVNCRVNFPPGCLSYVHGR